MYSVVELKEIEMKPKINDISLKLLSEYYEFFLYPFIYRYSVKSSTEKNKIITMVKNY